MIVQAVKPTYATEELLALPESKDYELVDGTLVERHVSVLSSLVGGRLHRLLGNFAEEHNLAWVWPADNGIQCFPGHPNKVRKPDVSLVRQERCTPELLQQGYLRIAPDLAVEVISPNDLAEDLDGKITEYQEAGIALIWIVNPPFRTVRVYRPNTAPVLLHENDELRAEDLLPGFHCRVGDLFPPQPAPEQADPAGEK